MERVIEQVVHVDEREVCLIQVKGAKLPAREVSDRPAGSVLSAASSI